MADDVLAFFDAAPLLFPVGNTITVPNGGDIIDDVTGNLAGSWTDTGTGGVATGTETGSYAKGVGLQVRWRTSGIVASRRVTGSTFMVPIAGSLYDTDGTIDTAVITSLQSAADDLVAAMAGFRIWSRPVEADPDHVPPIVARDGTSSAVVAAVCPDRVSWLRSRRT